MAYVSSNANRFYTALEGSYGNVPAIGASNRFPAVQFGIRQQAARGERRDKTGSRTFPGLPAGVRKKTTFELKTYMTSWGGAGSEPGYGPLFRAALGGGPALFNGGTAGTGSSTSTLVFSAAHGLSPGQAITYGDELRFVASIADGATVVLNAPLSQAPAAGAAIGAAVCYQPALELASVSLFDYWTPATAVQRILCGAAVDQLRVEVNADYHQFAFSGLGKDVIDSASFASGEGGLASFPAEPALGEFDYSIIPGHLGQAWLGNTPDRFYTLTAAEVRIDNQLELRDREFGTGVPLGISPGMRAVTANLELYEQDDAATKALYQAARQRSPISVMFQLGQAAGQLFGVYLKSVTPEVPEFNDEDARVQWRLGPCRAGGTVDDEVFVAFG